MHHILERQLKHVFGSINGRPTGLEEFLKVISDTYEHFDEDRALLDRSLELSSREFFDNSKNLVEAKEYVEKLVQERTRELVKEHAQLVASIDSLSVGLVLVDTANNVVISNKRTRDILNISDTSSNLTFHDMETAFLPVIDIRKYCTAFVEKMVSIETTDIMLGQKPIHITLSPVSLPESPDNIIGIVMLIEDNTENSILMQNTK